MSVCLGVLSLHNVRGSLHFCLRAKQIHDEHKGEVFGDRIDTVATTENVSSRNGLHFRIIENEKNKGVKCSCLCPHFLAMQQGEGKSK